MARYLITQSLLSAWLYQYDCAEGQEEAARESFLKALRREPMEQTDAMLRGISFEDAVQATLKGDGGRSAWSHAERWSKRGGREAEYKCVMEMAERMRGGAYQLTEYKQKTIAGLDFLLMAKCDWVKVGVIYDCKRVEKYSDVGKYYESAQHPMYLEVLPSAREFIYEICDGEDIYEERYTRADIPQSAEDMIFQFVKSLSSEGLLDLYKEKWQSKH